MTERSSHIAEVGGADAGLDVVAVQSLELTVCAGHHGAVQAAQQDAGGETFSDDGLVVCRLLPGVVQAGLALLARPPLCGVGRVKLRTVRGLGGVEAATRETLNTRDTRGSCGCQRGGGCGGPPSGRSSKSCWSPASDPPPCCPPGARSEAAASPLPAGPRTLPGPPPDSDLTPPVTRLAAGAPGAPRGPGTRSGRGGRLARLLAQLFRLEQSPLPVHLPVHLPLLPPLVALDREGGVTVRPDSSPGGKLPRSGEVVQAVSSLAVPDAGTELSQLGPHHPEAHSVLLTDEEVGKQRVTARPLLHIDGLLIELVRVSPVHSDVERLVPHCLARRYHTNSFTARICKVKLTTSLLNVIVQKMKMFVVM